MRDTVAFQLVGVGGDEDAVACNLRGDYLRDDVPVREAHDKPVFGGVVLVFGLGDEALAGVVIGFTLATAFILGLVATIMD